MIKCIKKISPVKGLVRFCKKRKFIPRYFGPNEILQKIGKVAYELRIPSELNLVNPVFSFFMLEKCIIDPSSFFLLKA